MLRDLSLLRLFHESSFGFNLLAVFVGANSRRSGARLYVHDLRTTVLLIDAGFLIEVCPEYAAPRLPEPRSRCRDALEVHKAFNLRTQDGSDLF